MSIDIYKLGFFQTKDETEKWMAERAVEGYVVELVGTAPIWSEGQPIAIGVTMRYAPDEAYDKMLASVSAREVDVDLALG